MGQLSFFSADYLPPLLADLGGVLAAHGQITVNSRGARLSILLDDAARADALVGECRARGITAEVVPAEDGQLLMRTTRCVELLPLAATWTRGAVKSAPDALTVTAGLARIWVIAAGHSDEAGYQLGLDPHTPDSVEALIAGCARAGVAGAYIGVRGGGPGIRIVGHRRLSRLIDTVGTLPVGLPVECYPTETARDAQPGAV